MYLPRKPEAEGKGLCGYSIAPRTPAYGLEGPRQVLNSTVEPPAKPRALPGPPTVCRIMAFMAIIMGLGPLVYILLGFR